MSVNTKVNGQLVPSAGLYRVTAPIGMADIYSTEEKEVGLWVDNKPLYAKTIHFGALPNNTTKTVAHNISNLDYIVNIVATAKNNAGAHVPIPQTSVTSAGAQFAVSADLSDIYISTGQDRSSLDAYVTIFYTKTTDTPWSGKFVPQGYGYVSSGDIYSLEERQVGVYADGKPLYQKTMRFTSGWSLGSWATLANLSSLNIERLVKTDGIFTRSSGGTTIQLSFNGSIFPESTNSVQYKVSVRYNNNGNLECLVLTYDDITYIDVTLQYTKTTDVAGSGEYVPSVGGGTDLITTLAEMGITATFVGDYSEMYNDFNHIVRLKDETMNGQGVYFTNNQHFAGIDLPLTLAVRARKGMIQMGYGTGTLPTMITEGTGRTQFRNIPAGGFDTITIPYGSVGFIGKYFVSEDASKECVFEIGI